MSSLICLHHSLPQYSTIIYKFLKSKATGFLIAQLVSLIIILPLISICLLGLSGFFPSSLRHKVSLFIEFFLFSAKSLYLYELPYHFCIFFVSEILGGCIFIFFSPQECFYFFFDFSHQPNDCSTVYYLGSKYSSYVFKLILYFYSTMVWKETCNNLYFHDFVDNFVCVPIHILSWRMLHAHWRKMFIYLRREWKALYVFIIWVLPIYHLTIAFLLLQVRN